MQSGHTSSWDQNTTKEVSDVMSPAHTHYICTHNKRKCHFQRCMCAHIWVGTANNVL